MKKNLEKLKLLWQKITKYFYKYIIFIEILLAIVVFCYLSQNDYLSVDKISKSDFGAFAIAIVSLTLFYQRIKNQETQIDLQIQQQVNERFTTAINLLGSNQSSARTGHFIIWLLMIKRINTANRLLKFYARIFAQKLKKQKIKKNALVMKFKLVLIYYLNHHQMA